MVMGIIILRKRYEFSKYLSVLMITAGIVICTIISGSNVVSQCYTFEWTGEISHSRTKIHLKKAFNSLFLLIHQECEEKYWSSFQFKKWWFSNGIFLNTFSKVQLIPIWHKKTRLDFRCSFGGCVALPCLRWLFSSPLEWESIKKCFTNSMANIHVKHFMLP